MAVDSTGGLGQLVADLFCTWVRARQAAEARAAETVELLLWWMDHDDYGFCQRLEKDIVKVLDGDVLEALAAEARARFKASAPDDRGPAGYPRRRWTDVLKHTLAAQTDAEKYLASGREDLWHELVADVRLRHGRKTSFMPGFERVAAGGPAVEHHLSILERARHRWPNHEGR